MADIASIYVTFAGPDEASRIGRQVVEEGLAACVNVLGPCQSIYRWQGEVHTADEVAALFKVPMHAAEALARRIAALHSYEVPAITVWPAERALPAFAKWVNESVGR
jgi:periplasmic divalent cation tolerance protein